MLQDSLNLDIMVTSRKLTCPVKGIVVDTVIHPSDRDQPIVELRIYQSQIQYLDLEDRRQVIEYLSRVKQELMQLPIADVWIMGVNGEPPG